MLPLMPEPDQVRRAAAEARKATKAPTGKRAVTKTARKGGPEASRGVAESSRKRPRSPSPTSPATRARREEVHIDLTTGVSPERPEVTATFQLQDNSTLGAVETAPEAVPPAIQAEAGSPSGRVAMPSSATIAGGAAFGSTPPIPETVAEPALSFKTLLDREGRWAERTMAPVLLPELKAALGGQKTSTFFREAFVAHLWTVNSLSALKDAVSEAREALTHSQAETQEASAALEALLAEKVEWESRTKEAEEKRGLAEDECRAQAERAQKALSDKQCLETRLKGLQLELAMSQSGLETANTLKMLAEERAEAAEETARRAETKSAEAEATAATTKLEAAAAVERAIAAAEERVNAAVEAFRQSSEYQQDLAQASAFAYNVGFEDCKSKAKMVTALEDLGGLSPDGLPEESPAEVPLVSSPCNDI